MLCGWTRKTQVERSFPNLEFSFVNQPCNRFMDGETAVQERSASKVRAPIRRWNAAFLSGSVWPLSLSLQSSLLMVMKLKRKVFTYKAIRQLRKAALSCDCGRALEGCGNIKQSGFPFVHCSDSKCLQKWLLTNSVISSVEYIAEFGGWPLGAMRNVAFFFSFWLIQFIRKLIIIP